MKGTRRLSGAQKTALALLLTLVIVVASAILPAALLRLEDGVLFAEAQPRAALGGELSDDNYLAWLLHIRAEGADNVPEEEKEPSPATTATADERERAVQKLQELVDAEVFLPALSDYAGWQFYANAGIEPEAQVYSDSFGFKTTEFYGYSGEAGVEGGRYLSLALTTESRTGKVTWLSINTDAHIMVGAAEIDMEASLQRYLAWLGLDTVEDWSFHTSGLEESAIEESEAVEAAEEGIWVLQSSQVAYAISTGSRLYAVASTSPVNPFFLEIGVYDENELYWWRQAG